MDIGRSIKVSLAMADKNPAWLAEQINVSPGRARDLMTAEVNITLDTLRRLADAFGVSVVEFIQRGITTTPDLCSDDARDVFSHWHKTMRKSNKVKPTSGRMTKIKSRLKDGYTKDDLIKAIDGCAGSLFHMGVNDDGTIYNDLTLIMRNPERVDFFIQKSDQQVNGFNKKDLKRVLSQQRRREELGIDSNGNIYEGQ